MQCWVVALYGNVELKTTLMPGTVNYSCAALFAFKGKNSIELKQRSFGVQQSHSSFLFFVESPRAAGAVMVIH